MHTDLESLEDKALIRLILDKNDESSLSVLFNRYEHRLVRYISTFGIDKHSAEDILQTVFLKTYKNLNGFDSNLKFSSWIYRIAHNEAINGIRKNKNHMENISIDEFNINMVDMLSDSDSDEFKDIRHKETAAEIQKVLKILPDKYREVIILRYFENRDYDEISDILQIPVNTVGTFIRRGKAQFKKLYRDFNP